MNVSTLLLRNMFCPIKVTKPKKSHQQIRSHDIVPNNGNNHIHKHNHDIHLATSKYRYVIKDFTAYETDELSVNVGDIVYYEYSDTNASGNWSHVQSMRTSKRGFVPSDVLSTEPRPVGVCKKKLPRSLADPIVGHHNHLHHASAQPSSIGDNNRHSPHQAHLPEHQPAFGIPHSLQGTSSGEQTFHKYPDLRAPGYYNLRNDPISSYEQYEMDRIELDFRPFQLKHYGTFVVTFNFVAREEHDLSVRPGEFVTLLNKDDEDWYWVRRDCDSSEGFVPARFICDYEQVRSIMNKGNSTATMKSSNLNDLHTYMNHGPFRGVRESIPTDQQSSVFQHI